MRHSHSVPTTRSSPLPRSCGVSPSTGRRRSSMTHGGASSKASTSGTTGTRAFSTPSPADTPLWDAMGRVSSRLVEGSALVPFLTVGATDARFFRRAGSVAYGFGLFSRKLSFDDYASMFHGNDERVDVDSLIMSTRLWEALAQDLLS